MKSKRAQKELEKLEKFYPFSGWIAPSDTYRIAEIAERDAEERMKSKAFRIIKEMMEAVFKGDMPQKIADEFIQKLTENEND